MYVSILCISLDGMGRAVKTNDKCPKCGDKKGKKAIQIMPTDNPPPRGLLVVFDENEIEGIPDFRDCTAIQRRKGKLCKEKR
jgi:hypothetical protein